MARIGNLPDIVLGDNQELSINFVVHGMDTSSLTAELNLKLQDGTYWKCKTADREPGSPLTLVDNVLSGTIPIGYKGSNQISFQELGVGGYPWNIDFLRPDGISEFRVQDNLHIVPDIGRVSQGVQYTRQDARINLTSAAMKVEVTVGGWDEVRVDAIEAHNVQQDGRLTAVEARDDEISGNVAGNLIEIARNASEIIRVDQKRPIDIFHGESFEQQILAALDTPMVITFGDVFENEYLRHDSGAITFKQEMYVRGYSHFALYRTDKKDITLTKFRVLFNGVPTPASSSIGVRQNEANITTIVAMPFPHEGLVLENDVMTVEMYQDSSAKLDGGLYPEASTLPDWDMSPSAAMDLYLIP